MPVTGYVRLVSYCVLRNLPLLGVTYCMDRTRNAEYVSLFAQNAGQLPLRQLGPLVAQERQPRAGAA